MSLKKKRKANKMGSNYSPAALTKEEEAKRNTEIAVEIPDNYVERINPTANSNALTPAEEAKRDEATKGNEVNALNSFKHVASGVPAGLAETINFPKSLGNMTRAGAAYAANLLPGVENVTEQDLQDKAPFLPPPLNYFWGESELPTEYLKKIPFVGPAVDEFSKPVYSPEQIENDGEAAWANGGRTFARWFQPGNLQTKTLKGASWVAATAASGGAAFEDEAGELFGLVPALFQLARGRATNEQIEAIELFSEQSGRSVDQLIIDAQQAMQKGPPGTTGTLGETLANPGMMRVEKLLKNQSGGAGKTQEYIDEIYNLDVKRNEQIVEDFTTPLRADEAGAVVPMRENFNVAGEPIKDPSVTAAAKIIEDRTNDVTKALDAELDKVDAQESKIRNTQIEPPTQQFKELEANQLLQQERLAEIEQKTINEQKSLTDFRNEGIQRTLNAMPEAMHGQMFNGIDMQDPLARHGGLQKYWNDYAFNEVKNKQGGFALPESLQSNIREFLKDRGVQLELKANFNTTTDQFRRARGIEAPDTKAKDFNAQEYVNSVFSGRMAGNDIMTLRNFMSKRQQQLYDSNDIDTANAMRSIKESIDKAIRSGLNAEETLLFDSQMSKYPNFLAEQKLQNTDAVVGNYGEATPAQQITAGSKFGRPGLEGSRKALQEQDALNEITKTAVSAGTKADQAVEKSQTALTKAITEEQRQIDRQQKSLGGLNQTKEKLERASNAEKQAITKTPLGKYKNDPSAFVKYGLKNETNAKELGQVFKEISEAGQKDAFRMTVAKEITNVLTDGNSKMNAASRIKFTEMRNRLNEAGLLTGEELNKMQEVLLRTSINDLRKNVDGSFRVLSESEADKVASSVVAAFALQLTGSSSLILAGTTKRVVANALKNDKQYEVLIRNLREMSLDPQKFIDQAELASAATDKEVRRRVMAALVGTSKTVDYIENK